MASREDIAARCVAVEKVPTELKDDLKHIIAEQTGLFEGSIPVTEVSGYHTEKGVSRFIFLLDAKLNANKLIEETKTPNLEKEGRNLNLKYESSVECEIPEEWTEIATQDTVGMDNKQGTPAVPPKAPQVPKRTPRRSDMMVSGFYENVTQQGSAGQGPVPVRPPGPSGQGQGPGSVIPQMSPGMPQPFFPQGFNPPPGQPQGQYPLPDPLHGQPGAQFQGMPGFPMGLPPNIPFVQMGPRGPLPFPGMPIPLEGKPSGQGGGHYMPMSPAFWGPHYYQMLQNQGVPQKQHEEQPHSGPPPPYNGSLQDQTDHTDSPDTTSQKVVVEEHQLSELKEPVPKRILGGHGRASRAVEDQDDYMKKLNEKLEKEKETEREDIAALSNDDLRKQLQAHGHNCGPVVNSTRQFYENKLAEMKASRGASTQQEVDNEDEEEEKSERSGQESFVVIDDERVNKILVSGLPEGISEDFLELAFEKHGGVVTAVEMNMDDNSAVIEFQDPDAVEEVLGKQAIKISNVVVDVKKYEPPPFEEPPQCTVRVSSIPHSVSEEFLLLYFENEKKSGGDNVAKIEFKEGDQVAFVTYKTEEVARRVVERQQFLNHVELEVCLHSPVQTKNSQEQYRNQERGPSRQQSMNEEQATRILVKNLPPTANEEYLSMFFENSRRQGGGPVSNVEFYPDASVAIVEFQSPDAVDTVMSKLPITMSGNDLDIEIYNPIPEEPVPLCTIEVRGPQDLLESEMLEMYFENERRSFGGSIHEISRQEDVTLITFKSEEVAQRVVEKASHQINKKTMEVCLHQPKQEVPPWQRATGQNDAEESETEPLCTVKITGISHVRSVDTLLLYFENSKRSGGGTLVEHEIINEDDMAFLTFETEEVARRVVEKGQHKVDGNKVEVTLYEPVRSQPRSVSQEDEEEEPFCSIKVKGISKIGSMDTLEFYFENAKRSGGGSIRNLDVHEEEDFAYVTFTEEDVAKRVVGRNHTVNKVDLNVSLYKPPKPRPAYSNRLIIKGVNPETTKDCLFNFLEAKSGASPTELVYGEQDGTVMVTFDSEPDFEKLEAVCKTRPLEGSTLNVSKVCISNCIIISNMKATTSSDTIQFYFENKRRSSGGEIEKVTKLEESGACLVFFQDYLVVEDVLKQKHKLEGQELKVEIYIESLGRSEGDGSEPRLKIPDAFAINDVEEKIVDFMKKSKSCKEAVKKQLEGCYAQVIWPEKGATLTIECEITVKTPDYRKLVKDWKNNVEKNLKDYLNQLSLKEHPVWDEGWDAVLEGLGEISIENPDAVALFVDKKEKIIRVVGYKHVVDSVSKTVERVIKDVSDEIERKKQTVKQTISNLKPLNLRLLLASKYPVKMEEKFQNLKVKINQSKNEVIFEGVYQDVQSAKVEMYEKTNSFAMRVRENISQNCIDLYQSKSVKDYIVKKLKQNKLVGVWEATDRKLAVCSFENTLSSCMEFISEAVQEKTLPVQKASASVLTSSQWQDRLKEIHSQNSGFCKVTVKEDFSTVFVTATEDIVDDLAGRIARFLKDHTIMNEIITLKNKSLVRLIQNHHSDKLSDIAKGLTQYYVQIHSDSRGLSVQGTEEGIQKAKEKLFRLAQQVKRKEHTMTKPGLASHMHSDKGQENIKSVESNCKVVIHLGSDESDDGDDIGFRTVVSGGASNVPDIGLKIHAVGDSYDDRKIYTAEGDMSQVQVDVLVNSADNSLSLSGGLGKVLANKGGGDIGKECKAFIQRFGKLNEGDVFLSTGGNLPAQFIVHVSSPHWQNGRRKEDEVLKDAVMKALQQASTKKVRSVAVPALGCGNYGFPLKTATEIITAAVKDFFREDQDTSIQEVYFVDVKPMTVEAFTDAAKRVFENVHPVSHGAGAQSSDDEDDRPSNRPIPAPRRRAPSSGNSSSEDSDADLGTGFGNISVEIVKGEIASEKVDIIVNTTGRNLDLRNGAVSASLLKVGGNSIQQDLSQNYPKGIADGEIAVSSSGKLKCKTVLHGSLMNWDGGDKAISALHKLMSGCLQEADKQNITSIAFPAVGTGQLGFPRDIVAKEMFSAIEKFGSKYPKSSVTEVKFVVYHKDEGTVRAFEMEKKNWSDGKRKTKRASRHVAGRFSHKKEEEGDGGWVKVPPKTPDGPLDIGGITITVKQGDITQSKVDAIINSSNEELDLSRGAVAKALLQKGGDKLRKEAAAEASKMKQEKMVITSAPGLQCKHIIHVVAQNTEPEWKAVIDSCLQLADDNQIKSLAFPALGTGLQLNPKNSAEMVLKSVQKFASTPPKHLKEINFIIYQDGMMKEFQQAVTSFNVEKSVSKKGSILQSMIDLGIRVLPTNFMGSYSSKQKSPKYEGQSSVTFVFYSLSMDRIKDAIKKLDTIIEQNISVQELRDSCIEKLSSEQVRELKAMAANKEVELDIKTEKSYLKITGLSQNVIDFHGKVQVFLRDVERDILQKSHAEVLKNVVQWYYIEITDVGQNLEKYQPQLNLLIEKAYKEQQLNYKFQDKEGVTYIVDFKDMEEYPENDKEDTVKVVRRDLIKESKTGDLPTTWSTMTEKENLRVVALQATDNEYKDVLQQFNNTSGGTFTVTKIDRIQNKTLYQQYQAKKNLLEQQNKQGTQNEKILWHGTAPEAVDSINAHGFNRSYCGKNATVYGDGVYFAVQAQYSASNTYSRPDPVGIKRMYLCRVLTGEYVMGKSGMRVPPQKASGATPHALYDSVVNNVSTPTMYIIFNDTQAYPDYLLAFK